MTGFFAAAGRFAVRFRWIVVVAWVAATVLAHHFFPSLTSVAQASNTSFLPASSPSLQAARLGAAFQGVDQTPVPVVIARTNGTLTAADTAAVHRLAARLAEVAGVQQVKDLDVSRDGQAAQLQVLAVVNLDEPGPAQDLTTGLRHVIGAAAPPGDLRAHLAGPLARTCPSCSSWCCCWSCSARCWRRCWPWRPPCSSSSWPARSSPRQARPAWRCRR
jgi:putative drug exporter of the RND superfamily